MNDAEMQAQIEAASAYEQLFVPALFQEWAPRVLAAAEVQPGHRVLDVACGTGVLAREAAAYVSPGGSVTGLDLNPGMLAVAERLAPAVDWRPGAAESLPFADESFDAVVSQFGLMVFADRPRAVSEMRRVLAPSGRLAAAVWDILENTPAYAAEVALVERIAGAEAAEGLRVPFALGDGEALAELFARAGVEAVDVTTYRGTARFPSVRTMIEADLRGWLPVVGVTLSEEQIGRILEEAEQAMSPFVTADGAAVFEMPAHIVTGTKS